MKTEIKHPEKVASSGTYSAGLLVEIDAIARVPRGV